jgi:hypothetical protein
VDWVVVSEAEPGSPVGPPVVGSEVSSATPVLVSAPVSGSVTAVPVAMLSSPQPPQSRCSASGASQGSGAWGVIVTWR